jgi:hypothetical protein
MRANTELNANLKVLASLTYDNRPRELCSSNPTRQLRERIVCHPWLVFVWHRLGCPYP